ncbi:hypothetical protein Ddye_007273, partial [Dipteronia dyeriana]
RLVLIKAVISSIPTYFLAVFNNSVGVANHIDKIQRSFLCGDNDVKQKFYAVRWVDVCKQKGNGGLGIGRILVKNKALLAKWVWMFGRDENLLWRRVICSKYGLDETSLFFRVQDHNKSSFL